MNQQEVRHQLAEAIRRRWVLRGDARADDFAAVLVPAVRSIVAKEVRRAADDLLADPYERRAMYERADELEQKP